MTIKFVRTRKPDEDLVLTPDMRKIKAAVKDADGAVLQKDLLKLTGLDVSTFYLSLLALTNSYHLFAYVGIGGTVIINHQMDPMLASDREIANEWGIEQ